MIQEKLIFKVERSEPSTFSEIFGANYYEDWDSTLGVSDTGGLVDSWTSQGLNGGMFTATGANRPTLTADANLGINVLDFDGVSDFMSVASSTADYNFLHNTNGGCVIAVIETDGTNPSTLYPFINNNSGTTASTGHNFYYEDRAAAGATRAFRVTVTKSSAGNLVIGNFINSLITDEDYNSYVSVFDPNNGTAADRSIHYINNGSAIQNNTNTNSPVATNATYNLHLGKLANSTSFYLNGQVARLIIIDTIPTAQQLADVQTRLEYEYGTFPI